MFDYPQPEVAELPKLGAAELVDAARGWAQAENAACARKLAVMAEIFVRRTQLPAEDRESWWIDPDAAVAAELAAALNVTSSMALHQTYRGVALRYRLPKVAALFEAGLINEILARAIVSRTELISDQDAMAAVDADLADTIGKWGARSASKTENSIDAMVIRHDPGALRRAHESQNSRDVTVGSPSDAPGFTTIWARLWAGDGAIAEKCLQEMADTVCELDPRSAGERRADAFTALMARTVLVCGCGTDDCESAGRGGGPAKNTLIYMVADAEAVSEAEAGRTEAEDDGEPQADAGGATGDGASDVPPVSHTPRGRSEVHSPARPAFVFGAGIVPTPLLSGLLDRARFRTVRHPGDAPAEPRYTPSRALADFIRCRDLTCRFPGCDKPASDADIDHTVPYPVGPTHASNLKCLCRFHHLLKTFWNGEGGWRDRQLPDGTVIWTSPTGHAYTTFPGSATLFPVLCAPTPVLWDGDPPVPDNYSGRGAMMPRRRHTRAANRARRIAAERRLNDDYVAEQTRPPPF